MVPRSLAETVIVNIGCTLTCNHRVDRVLSFFSSRQNWDPLTPHQQASMPSPLGSWGRDTLACGKGYGVGWSQIRREDRHMWYSTMYVTLGIYELQYRHLWERLPLVNVSYPTQSLCSWAGCTIHAESLCTGFGRLLFATHLLNFAYKNQE